MKKIKYFTQKNENVVIFDFLSGTIIRKYLFKECKCIIPCRNELYYVNLKIIVYFFYYYFKFIITKKLPKTSLLGAAYCVYLYSVLKSVNPKIVVTCAEYSLAFSWISKNDKNAQYYVICRSFKSEAVFKFYASENIFIKNLICFGEHDVKTLSRYGGEVLSYYALGSIEGEYFSSERKLNEYYYDVCLISSFINTPVLLADKEFMKGYGLLVKFLSAIKEKYNLKLIVSLRGEGKNEIEYFDKNIIGFKHYSNKIINENSTFSSMCKSKIIVTFNSTAGVIHYGNFNKVIFCNFSNIKEFSVPAHPSAKLEKARYDKFEKTFIYNYYLSKSKYVEVNKNHMEYLCVSSHEKKIKNFFGVML